MPIHMKPVLLLQILVMPVAVVRNVKEVLHFVSFVVIAIKKLELLAFSETSSRFVFCMSGSAHVLVSELD